MQKYYCSHCGQPIDPYANFCAYCGARQYHPTQATPPQTPSPIPAQPSVPPAPQPQAILEQESVQPIADEDIVPRRHLSPRAMIIFFINYVIMTSILLPFMIAYIFFDPLFALILIFCYAALCYVTSMITYNNFYFSIDQNGFEKDYGVFFKRHVSIPFDQIQNVNTTRTILDRMLGIARVDIETAGSASPRRREIVGGIRSLSEGHLPGVSAADAPRFHDLLLRKMNNNSSH